MRPERVQQPHVRILRREVRLPDGGPAVRQFQSPADFLRKLILHGRQRFQDAVHHRPQHARADLRHGFVNRHDPPQMQRRLHRVVVVGEDLEFRMQHIELAGIVVEFHLAEQRHLLPRRQHVGQIAAMKPLAHKNGTRAIRERGLEQAQVAPLEPRKARRAHLRDHRGHFARRKFVHRLHIAAVLIAERHVGEQVLDGAQALGLQHGRARRPDAFDVSKRSSEIHGGQSRDRQGADFRARARASHHSVQCRK